MAYRVVCTSCRTVLGPDETCDLCANRPVVDLDSEHGRAEWMRVSWTSEESARGFNVFMAMFIGILLSAMALGIVGVKVHSTVLCVAAFLFAPLAVCLLVAVLPLDRWSKKRVPKGADTRPLVPTGYEALIGRIGPFGSGASELAETKGPAIEAFELRVEDGTVLLRGGRSLGFELLLDDGRTIRVPEGRVRLEPSEDEPSSDAALVRIWLDGMFPEQESKTKGMFPYKKGISISLRPGDRIRMRVPPSWEEPEGAGYRGGGKTVRKGLVPWIEKA